MCFKNKFLLVILLSVTVSFFSCSKDDDKAETQSLVGTTWTFTDSSSGGSNTFGFVDETKANFTQVWTDTGVEYTDTKEATYTYDHPNVTIDVQGKQYGGTVSGETMNIGGFIYNKQ